MVYLPFSVRVGKFRLGKKHDGLTSAQHDFMTLIENAILLSYINAPAPLAFTRGDIGNGAFGEKFFAEINRPQPLEFDTDITGVAHVGVSLRKRQMTAQVGGVKTHAVITPFDAEGQPSDQERR